MATTLVIVESPAKAKTIQKFLDASDAIVGDVVVEASVGHIRDLPARAADVPEANKQTWEILGIEVDNDFKPLYVISADKRDRIRDLKKLMKGATELYLATDEDREGEAISWHLLEVLNPPDSMPVKRMVFHEITPQAITEAMANPRDIDRRLVDAQEARRLLDRIYGYGPLASAARQKVGQGTTVGRVQSVATRLVVERERQRMAFVSAGYWDLDGRFASTGSAGDDEGRTFVATMAALDGRKVATGKDFGEDGNRRGNAVVLDESRANALAGALSADQTSFEVRRVERKPYRRRPAAPFITSTFQQEAGRKLRLSSSMAMRSAQSLYEAGFITYMRTDSTTLSDTALTAARREIAERYGPSFMPDAPRTYANKVKNAQEAHEAIRPAGDRFRSPEDVAREVNPNDAKVYELIWKRTIASQMNDATGETVTVRLGAPNPTPGTALTLAGSAVSSNEPFRWSDVEFATSGTIITHQGFRLAYVVDRDEGDDAEEQERQLPPLGEGDPLSSRDIEAHGHETQPPARFTEASLVKRLEELGVGRPSTYASTIKVIQDREYVWKKATALVPSFKAFAVVNLLEQHFPDLIDYAFTARMEDDLDQIAGGSEELVPWLSDFYFGPADANGQRAGGLKQKVASRLDDIDAAVVNAIPIGLDPDGVLIVAKPGRDNSPYLIRGDDTASIPTALAPDELTVEKALELLAAPKGGRELGVDPDTGLPIYAKSGRFGPYVQLGDYDDDDATIKPKMASLFKTMTPERITLDDALELLSLPRTVGLDPADGAEITAQNGKFGPYLQKILPDGKKDSRSLTNEEQLFTVGLDEAIAVFAQPKLRGGRVAKPPLRELGIDPVSAKPMVLKDGRFGPYVTDGETNASLRKADDVETITDERASELLQDRRDRGPAPKKVAKRTAKKPTAKKPTVKKPAAKKPARKAVAKKAPAKAARAVTPAAVAEAAGADEPF
jgi:DNA topoisomerase-1